MAKAELPTTQRAYTLRLWGVDGDTTWRDALWATHEAVNKGAKVFGDWLLTLRGGLDHNLVDLPVPQPKKEGKEQPPRAPNEPEKRDRRIVLALSWISVESKRGAPECKYQIEPAMTLDALREILRRRGLTDETEIKQWLDECKDSLSAQKRNDAVWVNRSAIFDDICAGQDHGPARADAQKLLWHLFGNDYLALPRKTKKDEDESGDSADEKRGAVIQSGKGAGQRTRHPFSHLLGKGEPFGKDKNRLSLKDHWQRYLTGRMDADTGIPVVVGSPQTELHREMFSKAASRLAQIHTKIKQQEVERDERKGADEALRKIEQSAQTGSAYAEALERLNSFYVDREPRPRQITGWDRVVDAWARINPADEDRQIDEVKRLQDEEREKKFGDVNLFIRLADPDFEPVWRRDGNVDASLLKTYVSGMKARRDSQRLKVSSYRHPDPYFNPVFCQFGVSRPRIRFRRLKEFSDDPAAKDVRAIGLLLREGNGAKLRVLHGSSKRIDREIGSACELSEPGAINLPAVSRRSRLAIAVNGRVADPANVRVSGVFDRQSITQENAGNGDDAGADEEGAKTREPTWNGTLFTDRRKLARLGKLRESSAATSDGDTLHWGLIVSLELTPQGPWHDFINRAHDKRPFERTIRKDEEKWMKRRKGTRYVSWEGWPHEEANKPLKEGANGSLLVDSAKERKGHAQLMLCRLPGLRLLSVDLGHRYAAACAVWESFSQNDFHSECESARQSGKRVDVHDLWARIVDVQSQVKKTSKSRRENPNHPTVYFRRTGADAWARLDRQFVIKLQGEEQAARKPTDQEREAVRRIEKELGKRRKGDLEPRVDELMSEAVRTITLALRRHGDYARIAYRLTDTTVAPDKLDDHLLEVLMLWRDLAVSDRWSDPWAAEEWRKHIASIPGYSEPPATDEDATSQERRKHRDKTVRPSLRPVAEALAKRDRSELSKLWNDQWQRNDAAWQPRLRELRGLILPRKLGKPTFDKDGDRIVETPQQQRDRLHRCAEARHVGGLSLTRIATIKSLYQVLKAFKMRPEPDNPRKNVPPEGDDSLRDFGRRILDAMERMREQRVKQLASRIVEAALGIGSESRKHWMDGTRRARQRIDDPRFKPCHAVVIENLTNYRPEETRTRRENRQLMSWSSSKVKKYLSESCQLHGLHLREVSAAYTSRQDSRTGAPGVRCTDATVKEFFDSPIWRKAVKQARKKPASDRNAREELVVKIADDWRDNAQSGTLLRLPLESGEIFVSADPQSPAARGVQADLNAAANIGLRALLDPDWPGRWWYIPCSAKDGKPLKDKVGGSACIKLDTPLFKPSAKSAEKKEVVNLWRNASADPIVPGNWVQYSEYRNGVQYQVNQYLRKSNGTLLQEASGESTMLASSIGET